nr:ATP-binding protein [uncultured Cohaesibacter sp.]
MRKTRWFGFLNSIAGQLLILLILAMALFMTGIYISVRAARNIPLAPPVMLFTERQIGIAEALAQLPAQDVPSYMERLGALHPNVSYQHLAATAPEIRDLTWVTRNQALNDPAFDGAFSGGREGPGEADGKGGPPPFLSNPQTVSTPIARKLERLGDNMLHVTVFSRMPDESVISASIDTRLEEPPNHMLENIVVFTIVCMSLLLLWAIIFLIRPLRRLAHATNNIAKENAKPLKADIAGPTELRVAAMALNKMQDRIHHLIDDRTRMLAAVGHDLRTPVTRLRLRADTVEPEDLRLAFLRDLNMMDGLLKRLMTYFSKGQIEEEPVRLELSSLVDSLVCEWSDAGEAVEMTEYTNLTISARPNDLMRMVDNLIDNAVKYAGGCSVSVTREEDHACLRVIDHGPGIPQEEKLALQEPFARGDKARTMNDTSGFGLGLAIARKAAEMHGATLELADTDGGGLTVEVRFALV